MELITVTDKEPTIQLWRENASHLQCEMKEYGDEELVQLEKTASQYILIDEYQSNSYGSYSSGYIKLNVTYDKYVIDNGELIGFAIDKSFLPLDFSYYLYFSRGGSHTLSGGVDKYFLLQAEEVDKDVLNTLSTSKESRKKMEELFKKRYV